MKMAELKFASKEHEDFYYAMLEKSGRTDCYHRAFFYCTGISFDTRKNIDLLFDFADDSINPDGLHKGFQTSGSLRLSRLAFNLWNGFMEEGNECDFTPYELFDCSYAPYFFEAVKLRYPEYCRELISRTDKGIDDR